MNVDLAKRIAELVDGDQWQLADLLAEEFSPDEWGDGSSANTGLHAELRNYENVLAREYGVILSAGHLRHVRATALAWPRGERSPRASFDVHMRMRGADRFAEMKKRQRQADREKRALSTRMLRRFRADDNPKPGRPFDERMRRAIASAVRRELLGGVTTKRDDWWMAEAIVDEARQVAVTELRRLASAIAKGAISD